MFCIEFVYKSVGHVEKEIVTTSFESACLPNHYWRQIIRIVKNVAASKMKITFSPAYQHDGDLIVTITYSKPAYYNTEISACFRRLAESLLDVVDETPYALDEVQVITKVLHELIANSLPWYEDAEQE